MLSVDPESRAIVARGVECVCLGVERLDLPGPTHGDVIRLGGSDVASTPVDVNRRVNLAAREGPAAERVNRRSGEGGEVIVLAQQADARARDPHVQGDT